MDWPIEVVNIRHLDCLGEFLNGNFVGDLTNVIKAKNSQKQFRIQSFGRMFPTKSCGNYDVCWPGCQWPES
jgi:hypothetical protein